MRWFGFIFLLFFCSRVYASNLEILYSNTTDYKGVIRSQFIFPGYNFKSNIFRIKPISENLLVSIWNSSSNRWVSSEDLWTNQPYLSNDMSIHIGSSNFVIDGVEILLQNTFTGQVYKLGDLIIWNGIWYQSYLDSLNKNITSL